MSSVICTADDRHLAAGWPAFRTESPPWKQFASDLCAAGSSVHHGQPLRTCGMSFLATCRDATCLGIPVSEICPPSW